MDWIQTSVDIAYLSLLGVAAKLLWECKKTQSIHDLRIAQNEKDLREHSGVLKGLAPLVGATEFIKKEVGEMKALLMAHLLVKHEDDEDTRRK